MADSETVVGRYLRETGTSKRRLARMAGIPWKTVYRLATGKTVRPHRGTAQSLVDASKRISPTAPLTLEALGVASTVVTDSPSATLNVGPAHEGLAPAAPEAAA